MWWQHLIAEGFFVRDGNSFDGAAALLRTAPRVAPAFWPPELSRAKTAPGQALVDIAIEGKGCPHYLFCMSCGVLKQRVVALLALVLASAWVIVPSFAARPCEIGNASAQAASFSCIDDHCKSAAGDCTTATVCCSISTNLALLSVRGLTPIGWDGVSYPDNPQSLNGRHLEPDLHPPTATI
jgi:hypothetical protein